VPGLQPLGDAVDEQIGDLVFRQVTAGEGLVVGPQPLAERRCAIEGWSSITRRSAA